MCSTVVLGMSIGNQGIGKDFLNIELPRIQDVSNVRARRLYILGTDVQMILGQLTYLCYPYPSELVLPWRGGFVLLSCVAEVESNGLPAIATFVNHSNYTKHGEDQFVAFDENRKVRENVLSSLVVSFCLSKTIYSNTKIMCKTENVVREEKARGTPSAAVAPIPCPTPEGV
jgi:hypothetical protein